MPEDRVDSRETGTNLRPAAPATRAPSATNPNSIEGGSDGDDLSRLIALALAVSSSGLLADAPETWQDRLIAQIVGFWSRFKSEIPPETRCRRERLLQIIAPLLVTWGTETGDRDGGSDVQLARVVTPPAAIPQPPETAALRTSLPPRTPSLGKDPAVQRYLRRQMSALLQVAVLETTSSGIQTPSFCSAHHSPIQPLDPVRRFEPRIDFVARQLSCLLGAVGVFFDGARVVPQSFRLRRSEDWLVSMDDDPALSDPYLSVLQYLSHPCDAACSFCLHKNDPPGLWTRSRSWLHSAAEVQTRLTHYDPARRQALFRTSDYSFYEMLAHPDALEAIRAVRTKSTDVIGFATNGKVLNADFLTTLASLGPYYLMVSLNSINPEWRRKHMRDQQPQDVVAALPLLRRHRILYSVSIVPDSGESAQDFEDTIRYADANDAYVIRINLDAYSRHFPNASERQPEVMLAKWCRVVRRVRALRREIETPIIFQPSHFEENLKGEDPMTPRVNGVIKHSPAAEAGLRYGDTILRIDDVAVDDKTMAIALLRAYQDRQIGSFRMDVVRSVDGTPGGTASGQLTLRVEENFDTGSKFARYPHFFDSNGDAIGAAPTYPYGVLLQPTFNAALLMRVKRAIDLHGAVQPLILSSYLLAPTVRRAIMRSHMFDETNLAVEVPANQSFLGGSIIVGDLLVAQDFIDHIQDRAGPACDLVLIPSTPFGVWGRDISGEPYQNIEREIGVPVVLLDNPSVLAL